MQFVREYGLVPNRSNPERFIKLVRWEGKWVGEGHPAADAGYETYILTPSTWEWELLDRPGKGLVWTPVRITRTKVRGPMYTGEESEELRRARIRAIRRACHVDESKGAAEPQWLEEPARAAA